MTTIPVMNAHDNDELLLLQVLPGGHMTCYLDEQVLTSVPTPVLDWAAVRVGSKDLPPNTPTDRLREHGIRVLTENAPVHVSVPVYVLHAEYEGAN